ncbi:hypothetical protein DID88_004607 [Monilinia fructigena]|uniref:tRNA (adenine(58)-N(1))-methyltransferase non-catalytic subunit TRM6 n=1 Tax=Monilinia fructigena TaxID=38457 RepID=A0A395IR10_9HELO|nr:hypothetical protein DID88_004607 [Monilinia fructigena]
MIRLPSDNLKVLQVVPNTPISLGKYGTFPSNLIIDRPYNLKQTLTQEEIETLKRDGAAAGKDLIAKLMLSHTALDEKTAFSLAKYKLLKTRKYLRQFTILPMDVQ